MRDSSNKSLQQGFLGQEVIQGTYTLHHGFEWATVTFMEWYLDSDGS